MSNERMGCCDDWPDPGCTFHEGFAEGYETSRVEIERLRAEIESGVEDSAGWRERCIEQDAEIEALRSAIQGVLDDADTAYYERNNDDWFLLRLRRALEDSDE